MNSSCPSGPTAPGPRCGTAALPARRRTDRARTAPRCGGDHRGIPGHSRAAEHQLTGHVHRRGLQCALQDHMEPGAGHRTADRHGTRAPRHLLDGVPRRGEGVLRRPVAVQQCARPRPAQGLADVRYGDVLAAEVDTAQRLEQVGGVLDQPVQQRSGDQQCGHPVLADRGAQLARAEDEFLVEYDQLRAVGQRTPDLVRRTVEVERGEVRDGVVGAQRHELGAVHHPQHPAVRQHDPFGRPVEPEV